MKVGLIFGTRPEAIKMAPLYHKLRERAVDTKIIATAQHRQMLDQVLNLFDIQTDYDLDIMTQRQTLSQLTSRLCSSIDQVLNGERFDWILTQGDTTSTFVGSLISFYHKIPLGHVEAGLRTFDRYDPFPEEINRRMTSQLATLHFAPTSMAKDNLVKDNIDPARIYITGNTVIDALHWVKDNKSDKLDDCINRAGLKGKKYILMTMHRRENLGENMMNVMKGVKKLLEAYKDYHLVFPVHYSPAVRDVVFSELKGVDRVILIDPVEYLDFLALMKNCEFIISDSGGIQEEAPSLGKPVLVLRKTTERPEALESGVAKLIGTESDSVFNHSSELITDKQIYERMSLSSNPFGDGDACERISDAMIKFKKGSQ